jgi:hypothetical protein
MQAHKALKNFISARLIVGALLHLHKLQETTIFAVPRRSVLSTMLSTSTVLLFGPRIALAETTGGAFREYIDTFDGYSFLYPKNWIQVRGSGADIFFRDPFVLDENMSVEMPSPSSSKYATVEDLGPPEKAAERVLKQCLTEFMSTRLGVRRESNVLTASSKVADDGKLYYEVEVNQTFRANFVIFTEWSFADLLFCCCCFFSCFLVTADHSDGSNVVSPAGEHKILREQQ